MTSALEVTGVDHPALRNPGCRHRILRGTIGGFLVGAIVPGLFGGYRGLRYGVPKPELYRVVRRQMFCSGVTLAVGINIITSLLCY